MKFPVQIISLSAGLSSLLQNWLYSNVSPLDFFTFTTTTDGATENISAAIPSFSFLPVTDPERLRKESSNRRRIAANPERLRKESSNWCRIPANRDRI
ncbi:hypothetical protein SASPL_108165 [Salvia splendens]|uniref:Uncharacterized protein n=1 Tax=Salvia splendens TaxID=180675 RepID=A0A8X8YEU0_SALSN|nr:hypothetical protein SASPL_108165 [Salvia splendens]